MFAKRFADPAAWRRKLLSKWQFKVEKSDFQDGFSKFLFPKMEMSGEKEEMIQYGKRTQ
jgi:hypothetical protein